MFVYYCIVNYKDAKQEFIQAWGTLGSKWGINRTMAQINALLLIAPEPLSAEQIMEELGISRGNVNMNVRTLVDWGIAHKVLVPGDRKEYFRGEKDMWELASRVVEQRRRKEIEPILKTLERVKNVEGSGAEEKEFKKVTKDISIYSKKMDGVLDKFIRADEHWFTRSLKNVLK